MGEFVHTAKILRYLLTSSGERVVEAFSLLSATSMMMLLLHCLRVCSAVVVDTTTSTLRRYIQQWSAVALLLLLTPCVRACVRACVHDAVFRSRARPRRVLSLPPMGATLGTFFTLPHFLHAHHSLNLLVFISRSLMILLCFKDGGGREGEYMNWGLV